jgi:hypothetical protein
MRASAPALAVAVLAAIGLAGCQDDPPTYFRIDTGFESGHQASDQAGYVVIEDAELWRAFWTVHAETEPDAEVPPVDFETHWVLAVFAGAKPTSGHYISVAGLEYTDATYHMKTTELRPAADCPVLQVITHPFEIVAITRVASGPVNVVVQPQPGSVLQCT